MATAAPSSSGASAGPSSRISLSLVTDYGPGGSTCGYCGSRDDVNWSHGMQAELMTVETYQALLDRGWRRSGRWIYKPLHTRTCCQLITIRLDVEKFQMSKDQRQVQRKWEAFLAGAPLKQKNHGHDDEEEQLQGGSPKRMREEEELNGIEGWRGFGRELQGGGKRQRSSHNLAAMDQEQENGGSDNDDGDDGDALGLNRAASPTTELSEQLQIAHVGAASNYSSLNRESEPWTAHGNGHSHHQNTRPPPFSSSSLPVAGDLSENLRKELQAALESCIEAGTIPDLDYPLLKVSHLTPKQRKKLPSDVAYTSPAPLAVTGIAKRAEIYRADADEEDIDDDEEADIVPATQPLSLETTAQLLLDQMRLPEGISGAEVLNGHINFKVAAEQAVVAASTSTPSIKVKKSAQQHFQSKEKQKTSHTPAAAAAAATTNGIPRSPPRHFELRMLPSSDKSLVAVEFELYKKYQVKHHGDSPRSVTEGSFSRFLCDTPLIHAPASSYPPGAAPPCGFGSFHQQYWMDGRLIAVGVIDILPRALSSKYLFWDPDYASLSLGKLASIQEIAWIREARASCPSLKYYYLGYYLHTCHRMRYKAEFGPSDLLCPVKQCWVPIDRVTSVLDHGGRAPALADAPGALEGLDEEYLVSSEGQPLIPPRMPSPDEINEVKLFIQSAGEGRRGQLVTFGELKQSGVLKEGAIAHWQHRLQELMMMVGPVWKNIAFRILE